MEEIGTPFAVRTQGTWLGQPWAIETELVDCMADNPQATRSGDRTRTAEVAARFDAIVGGLVRTRRDAGDDAPEDVTTELPGTPTCTSYGIALNAAAASSFRASRHAELRTLRSTHSAGDRAPCGAL